MVRDDVDADHCLHLRHAQLRDSHPVDEHDDPQSSCDCQWLAGALMTSERHLFVVDVVICEIHPTPLMSQHSTVSVLACSSFVDGTVYWVMVTFRSAMLYHSRWA